MENKNMISIPLEKLRFADPNRKTNDKKFDTKPMSYAKDVFTRFCKNKSSVVAAIIIILLTLFAMLVPIFGETTYSQSLTDTKYLEYQKLLPKSELFAGTGFWDGTKKEKGMNENTYNYLSAIEVETGRAAITEVYDKYKSVSGGRGYYYDVRTDSYVRNGMTFLVLTKSQFEDIQKWQNENKIQVIYPSVNKNARDSAGNSLFPNASKHSDANIWYATDSRGAPVMTKGKYTDIYMRHTDAAYKNDIKYANKEYYDYDSRRVPGDDGSLIYAEVATSGGHITYTVRVFKLTYFQYRYGHEASFLFGTNEKGQDILTRLAAGARFSLVLAICISAINLFIGAMYGAVEGFYGGAIDLIMERISDVLGGMPSMVVMSLFQLHLASKVGPVWSMAFAFILTGWLGMAGRTRMQFYRFKHQEYVLAARTLGASDKRLIFKHIFPNAMGTLITGSVLSIPGVIFSESSLTYLGIVNLESSTQTSVGTLLSNANEYVSSFPHIILFPALFISLLEISFNLFGNGLRDAFNPSLKGIED